MVKEMLSTVTTHDKFQSVLLGSDIHVFTDYKILMFVSLKPQCILQWQTKVEEFSPVLNYIEGPCNILNDNLSWLHHLVTLVLGLQSGRNS